MKRYVAVAGTIGAGKTSLVAWLVKRYGLEPFYEPNDENPYLADFYEDMKTWAFHSQVFFLSHKLKLHQELLAANRPAVIDRTIYEDAEIFARSLKNQRYISARDWAVYERLYEGIKKTLRPPDVLVALTCSLGATKKRIERRGRAMEATIPDAVPPQAASSLRGLVRAVRPRPHREDRHDRSSTTSRTSSTSSSSSRSSTRPSARPRSESAGHGAARRLTGSTCAMAPVEPLPT